MRSAAWAEWIIAHCTDPSQAASIVGDLLETSGPRGVLRFWISAAVIIFSLFWRRPVAFMSAFYLGLLSVRLLQVPLYAMRDIYPAHRIPHVWAPFFAVISGLGMVLWIAAPYAAIRYGIRDNLAQLALAFCIFASTGIYYWWIPAIAAISATLTVVFVLGSLLFAPRRRALLALAATLLMGAVGGLTAIYLAARYEMYLDAHAIGQTYQLVVAFLSIFAVAIVTTACARAHRLMRIPN